MYGVRITLRGESQAASLTRRAIPSRVMADASTQRLPALDWLRGLVIVLMAVDHASGTFNAGRFVTDSSFLWTAGTAIPVDQFLLRWVTHLCAPTFVFLAGTSLALSSARRSARGESRRAIDGALLKRGALLALLDPLWMSLGFFRWTTIILQVLFALGIGMMLMVPLRRLSARVLLIGALAFLTVSELLVGAGLALGGSDQPTLLTAVLLSAGQFPLGLGRVQTLIAGYPVLPWLAVMVLGHVFGTYLLSPGALDRVARKLVTWGVAALLSFLVVRGANGYGNMSLLRDDGSLVHFLHCSKYPPSLSYLALELGLMALLLAGFFALARAGVRELLSPLALLGQTSLFFYLLHVHLLEVASHALGARGALSITVTMLAAIGVIVVLWDSCEHYLRYKQAHPDGWTRYL
jgi:uncharacterized membrane protein